MADFVYCNITPPHLKIWGYDSFKSESGPHQVIIYYGRIGIPMHQLRKHEKHFLNWADAYDYVRHKVEEKTHCNGYFPFPNHRYFAGLNGALSLLLANLEDAQKKYEQGEN